MSVQIDIFAMLFGAALNDVPRQGHVPMRDNAQGVSFTIIILMSELHLSCSF